MVEMMRRDPAFRKARGIPRSAHAKMYGRAAGLPMGVAIGFAPRATEPATGGVHGSTPICRGFVLPARLQCGIRRRSVAPRQTEEVGLSSERLARISAVLK